MKKYDLLYSSILDRLTYIAESPATDTYSNIAEADGLIDIYADFTEQLLHFRDAIAQARADNQVYQSFATVEDCLSEFHGRFPNFPGVEWLGLKTLLLFGNKLASYVLPLDEDNIDVALFSLRSVNEPIECAFLSFSNRSTQTESIVFISLIDYQAFKRVLNSETVAPELLYQMMGAIASYQNLQFGQYALVKKTTPEQSDAAVESFVKLHVICQGRPVHRPHAYTTPPMIIDRDAVSIEAQYQQLNEVIYVLSEYNSRTEVLTKYLTIYHAIENFMFKLPIVDMETRNLGQMFSIRDFRRLYDEVSRNELDALRKMIARVCQQNVSPGITFGAHVLNRWNSLSARISPADLAQIMNPLNIKGNSGIFLYSDLTVGALASRFSDMVYALRNAIVHNKATEFHLTYANLEPNFRSFFEHFMLPTLEELTFLMVTSRNNIVWYSRQHLLLYPS